MPRLHLYRCSVEVYTRGCRHYASVQSNKISWNDDTSMNSHRQQLDKTLINKQEVEDDVRHVVKYFMDQQVIKNIILSFIVANSSRMSIGTFCFISDDESVNDVIYYGDPVFFILFTIEGSICDTFTT